MASEVVSTNKETISRRNFLATCTISAASAMISPKNLSAKDNSCNEKNEVTFFATSNPHYGRFRDTNSAGNKKTIQHMNSAPGKVKYPDFAGGQKVKNVRGVLVCGDLTQSATKQEFYGDSDFDGFDKDFKVDGSGRLKYPVYECYGNHDYELNGACNDARDAVKARNKLRKNLSAVSDNGYHYSWDWANVHFVNLNLFAGRESKKMDNGNLSDPIGSLDFLADDLRSNVNDPKRPIILFQHYGMNESGLSWWSAKDRNSFYNTIKDYNIIGIFHGHNQQDMVYSWKGLSVYNINTAIRGGWAIIRIRGDKMFVGLRHLDQWTVIANKTIVA